MRKLFKERKLFKGGNYMRKYGTYCTTSKKNRFEIKVDRFNYGFFSESTCNIFFSQQNCHFRQFLRNDELLHREVRKYVKNDFTISPNPKFHDFFDQSYWFNIKFIS